MGIRNRDARLVITVSDDEMKASGILHPAVAEGRSLGMQDIKAELDNAGIVSGIVDEGIKKALSELDTAKDPVSVLLAGGTPAEDADPAYLKLSQKLFNLRLYGKEQGGRVDFREARPFIIVHKDEALGRYQPPSPGTPGRTVTGRELEPGLKKRIPFEPGDNTYRDGDYIRASIAGRFSLQRLRFSITKVLELGGVDFHSGNIRYPGDVVLRGEICDGFTFSCAGDLHAAVPLDVTEVKVKGDLTVEGGILGREPGTLKVGGAVKARFIENLDLECRGSVSVNGVILQSSISTLGFVRCGEKGRIFNSTIQAVEGLEAQQLGHPAGRTTIIRCGSDFRKLKLYAELKEREEMLARQLGENKPERSDEYLLRMRQELEELKESASAVLREVNLRPEARIMVRDSIYPGVTIEICQVIFRVNTTIPRGTFYLDREQGVIKLTGT
ncbi:FapA family protein [Marispirochaeta sp.]|uniref:DUF342 domain-containing protein n=1 Tax=Marispirochaeta sp. TaxID=2038653 RepID=UPI0029C5FDDE|nr:FapA family protein [Marispirochaeta sp.]